MASFPCADKVTTQEVVSTSRNREHRGRSMGAPAKCLFELEP